MKFDWKKIVRSIAPIIGSVIPGPFDDMLIKIASDALLGKPDGTDEELYTAALNMTPDQTVALRQADYNFKIKMQELTNESDKVEIESVTKRHETDTGSDSWLSKNIRPLTLLFVTVSIIFLAYFTIFTQLQTGQLTALTTWTAVLLPVWITIIGFYFGSRGLEKIKGATK